MHAAARGIRRYLPGFYSHLVPMLAVLAVLKFLILTRFLADPANGLFFPVTDIDRIVMGVFLETLPVTVLMLLFFLVTGLGRLRRTLLGLQSAVMVLDIAGLYFFTVYREWFRFEDFHLLQGASFTSAGDLIGAEVPVVLLLFQIVLAVAGFLFLHKKIRPILYRKFSSDSPKRSGTRTVVHSYLLLTLVAGLLNLFSVPLFGKSGTYGNTAVTRLVGSILEEQLISDTYSLKTGPDRFDYPRIRSILYRASDYTFPDTRLPFLRKPRYRDSALPDVLAGPGKYNIILFVLESLSTHIIGAKHKGKRIAPTLADIARRGLSFRRIYTSGFPSARGHEAMFYGLYPPMIEGYTYAKHPEVSFVQRLKEHGYRTGCFAATFYQPLRGSAFFTRAGHEFYRYPSMYGIRPRQRIAAETKMLKKMHKHILSLQGRRPFMMTFLSEIGHIPYWYYPFDSKIPMLFPRDKETETRYATQMHFIGELVGRFIRRVEKLPAYRNTVFIIMADHRPHKELKYSAFTRTPIRKADYWHKKSLIPLIIYAPGIIYRNRYVEARPGGQIDLGPTVLQITGIPRGTHRAFGQSLIRRRFNYERMLMLHGRDAVVDNRLINENEKTVSRLPIPAGSHWSGQVPARELLHRYTLTRKCLRRYRRYYQQAARWKPFL